MIHSGAIEVSGTSSPEIVYPHSKSPFQMSTEDGKTIATGLYVEK